jgi:hypothetical protein
LTRRERRREAGAAWEAQSRGELGEIVKEYFVSSASHAYLASSRLSRGQYIIRATRKFVM